MSMQQQLKSRCQRSKVWHNFSVQTTCGKHGRFFLEEQKRAHQQGHKILLAGHKQKCDQIREDMKLERATKDAKIKQLQRDKSELEQEVNDLRNKLFELQE